MVPGSPGSSEDWEYAVVSVGVPAMVRAGKVVHEPANLGRGLGGLRLRGCVRQPTKVVNDAAMQALGSYEGGRMLFLGLGTGLGSTMIVDGIVEPMELGHLPFRKATYEDYVGLRGLERLGKKRWRKAVYETIETLAAALEPDYVVLGGGNAGASHELPAGRPAGPQRGRLPRRLQALALRPGRQASTQGPCQCPCAATSASPAAGPQVPFA